MLNAKWIKPKNDMGTVVPKFKREFALKADIKNAVLNITAMGVYEATLNGKRVGNYVLAPGWTSFATRLQYQSYDVTDILSADNVLEVTVGKGWYDVIKGWDTEHRGYRENPAGLIAQLELTYVDGSCETVVTDDAWSLFESNVRFTDIYDGEVYDASADCSIELPLEVFDGPTHTLITQEGEIICEQERICPVTMFTTPKGERVIDFGQNLTGYVEIKLTAKTGERVDLSFAEVLDKEGNFYNANYRSAKCMYTYVCKDGYQEYKTKHTFYGFRYVRVNEFPSGADNATAENFTAIVVHSDIRRTGRVECSDYMLNRLFENCLWGQKDNFLDVPTDCPQRDERLGWTGDAQVFVKTAALQFDVEKFFCKWLADMAADQEDNGEIKHVVPNTLGTDYASAAWGDASVICPWEIYLAYGDEKILRRCYPMMKKWLNYIAEKSDTEYLWTGCQHYGDWLGLDAPSGSYKGSSRDDFIASAFYAYSTSLVIKAGRVIGEDVSYYEELYKNIVNAFHETFDTYTTQTEHVLAIHFDLATDKQKTADDLAELVRNVGTKLQTGFVGTPFLLYTLSRFGHVDLAYDLLLKKDYPSWLYSVTKGATTIWEHWDSIMEDGGFWSTDMNSFNHYAYGSVLGWVFNEAAGIMPLEEGVGYNKIRIAPKPDARLDWLSAELETRRGLVISKWHKKNDVWCYEITTPSETEIIIDGKTHNVSAGKYVFYERI